MSTITAGLAGRYATALYQLAIESKQVDDILQDLHSLNKLIDSNEELRKLIYSPVFSTEQKASVVTQILKKAKASP